MTMTGINIFARELAYVLDQHQARIGQLNDNPRIQLHPAVVSRLQHSLKKSKPLVTLNPEVLELVILEYHMTDAEQARLKAAVLATAVERMLMDRIDEQTALMAANEVFHMLHAALDTNKDLARNLKDGPFIEVAPPAAAGTLDAALEAYDAAMLDLHLAAHSSPKQRGFQATEALQGFMYAHTLLRACSELEKRNSDWQFWYDEVERGQQKARALINEGVS